MTDQEAPRTEPTTGSGGSTTWTFRGPVEIVPDPQSGAVHITFAGAAASSEPNLNAVHKLATILHQRESAGKARCGPNSRGCRMRHRMDATSILSEINADVARSAAPSGQTLDVERLQQAFWNVMDGRRVKSVRLGADVMIPGDWDVIAAEYARLAESSEHPE